MQSICKVNNKNKNIHSLGKMKNVPSHFMAMLGDVRVVQKRRTKQYWGQDKKWEEEKKKIDWWQDKKNKKILRTRQKKTKEIKGETKKWE